MDLCDLTPAWSAFDGICWIPQGKQNVTGREEEQRTEHGAQHHASARQGEMEAARKAPAKIFLNGPMGDNKT